MAYIIRYIYVYMNRFMSVITLTAARKIMTKLIMLHSLFNLKSIKIYA